MKIAHPTTGEIEFDTLRSFICDAKKDSWASGRLPKDLPNNVEGYRYSVGNLLYTDEYRGDGMFIGTELVYLGSMPIWGMNYAGAFRAPPSFGPEQKTIFKGAVNRLLRKSLMEVPIHLPFRGPESKVEDVDGVGNFAYTNNVTPRTLTAEQAIRLFAGSEEIQFRRQPVPLPKEPFTCFSLKYHGGILVPDSFLRE